MRFHDTRDEAWPMRQQKLRTPTAVARNRSPKRWSRRRSRNVHLVPYEPKLSPIFEESLEDSSRRQSSQPLLRHSSRPGLSYGAITQRLNRVVIAVEEHDDSANQPQSSWAKRMAKILADSCFVPLLSIVVLFGGVFLMWLAFAELDGGRSGGGGMGHRKTAMASVGVFVVVMAAVFVLWKPFRALCDTSR